MPHVIERATTGRAKCRGCAASIAAGTLRLGERVPNPFGDDSSETTHWYHVTCGALTRPEAFLQALQSTAEPIDNRETLERDASQGAAQDRLPRARAAERAPTGRATCRSCREPIAKDAWRICLAYYEEGRFVPSGFIHAGCAQEYFGTTDILPRLRHFSAALTDADIAELEIALRP